MGFVALETTETKQGFIPLEQKGFIPLKEEPSFFQKAKETVSTFFGAKPEPAPAEIPAIQKLKGESTLGLTHPEQVKAGQMLRAEKEYKSQVAIAKEAMAKQPEFYQGMTPEDVIKRQELHKEGMGEVTQPVVDPIDFASFVFGGGLPSLAKTALKGTARATASKTIELGLKSAAIGIAQIPIGQTTDVLSETRLGKQYPEAVVAFNFIANVATIYGIDKAVNNIANSNLWRRMSIKERGLVVQSIEDLKTNGMSEGKIARYYPQYKEQLIKERMLKEEPSSIKISKALGKENQIEVLEKMGVKTEAAKVGQIVNDAVTIKVSDGPTADKAVKEALEGVEKVTTPKAEPTLPAAKGFTPIKEALSEGKKPSTEDKDFINKNIQIIEQRAKEVKKQVSARKQGQGNVELGDYSAEELIYHDLDHNLVGFDLSRLKEISEWAKGNDRVDIINNVRAIIEKQILDYKNDLKQTHMAENPEAYKKHYEKRISELEQVIEKLGKGEKSVVVPKPEALPEGKERFVLEPTEGKEGEVKPAEAKVEEKVEPKTEGEPDFRIMATEQPKIRQYKTVKDVIEGYKQGEIDYQPDKYRTIPYSEVTDKAQVDEWINKISPDSKVSITKDYIVIKEPSIRNEEGDIVKGNTHKFPIVKQKVENIVKQEGVSYLGDTVKRGVAGEKAAIARKTIKELMQEDPDFASNPTFKIKEGMLEFEIENRKYRFLPKAISSLLEEEIKTGKIKDGQTIQLSKGYIENKNPDLFLVEGKATPSGLADVGGYARGEASPSIIEMPEITEIAKELMAGKYPKIAQKLRIAAGQALGQFRPIGAGEIKLKADIFKDPELAKKVFSHEIGHLVDYLPEGTMARGNILGRIASLKKYMSSLLEESPTAAFKKLTPEDRAKLRAEAIRQSKLAGGRLRANVSPETILDIWRKTEGWDKELYDYIAKLSNFDKKQLMQKALAGVIPDWFKFKFSEAPEDVKVLYKKLLEDEIIRRGLFKRDTIMSELKEITQIWKPFNDKANPTFTKYRYSPKELYADAFSVLLNNPKLLQSKAPEFYRAFFNWMEAKPEVMSLYESIQDRLTRPEEVLQKRDYNIEQMYLRGEEKQFQAQEKQTLNIGDILISLKTELIDANARLIKKVKGIEKQGVKIAPEDNPRYWIEELPYTSSEVLNMLRDINVVKSSLNSNGISDVDIGKYMMLKRVSTERAEMANPLGHTKETAIAHLEFMKKKLGTIKFQQLEEGVKHFRELRQKNVISVIEKSKMLDPETIELIKNAENYATFDVQAYIEKRFGRIIGSRIYKQIGTLNEITNPFTATIMKDAAMLRAANRKMAADVTVKFLQDFYPSEIIPSETRWNGKYQEPIDSKDPSKDSITFLHEGKIQSYYVDKYIAKSFNRDPYEASIILKAFQVVSRPIKEILVSKNPAFIMWNIQRDIKAFAKQVPGASLLDAVKYAVKSIPDAYKDVFKNISTEDVAEMYKNRELIVGRIYGGEHLSETKQLDRLLNSYGENPVVYRNKVLAPFQRLWNWLDKPGQMAERVTKIAGHKFLNDFSKLSEKEKAHIIRIRAGSPDFKRAGNLVALYNNLFLFSNAGKEGIRASVEAFRESPSVYAWKTMKYDIIPKLLMYGAGIGLFGMTIQKLFNNIPDNDKTNYMTIPLGETKEKKTVYFVMPHDFQGQLLAGVMWRMLNTRKLDDIQQLADYAAGGLPYQGLHPLLGVALDAAQYATGKNPYDSFRGKYVIPEQRFIAGGWQAHQILLKHIANNLGMASLIYRFPTDDLDRIKGTLEKSKDIPVAGRLVDRFIRVSNRGQAEQYKEVSKDVRQSRAEENISIQDAIIDNISSGKVLSINEAEGLYIQLMNEGKIQTTKFEDFLNTYKKFAVKRNDIPFINAYMAAQSKEEKIAIVQKYIENE